MVNSKDYHDYVFRDGKLLGEFEQMYRNSSTTPWHQDDQADWIDVRLTMAMLQNLGEYSEIHDFGAGTGHYLDLIVKHCLAPEGKSFGYDISETACKKASTLFPNSSFTVLDITQVLTNDQQSSAAGQSSRLFMIRGTLWYVFPNLDIVVTNLAMNMRPRDHLLVVQNFPPLHSSFIGKDVLPDHLALLRHFAAKFIPIRYIWYEDQLNNTNDNWFIGLFSLIEAS